MNLYSSVPFFLFHLLIFVQYNNYIWIELQRLLQKDFVEMMMKIGLENNMLKESAHKVFVKMLKRRYILNLQFFLYVCQFFIMYNKLSRKFMKSQPIYSILFLL